MYNITPISAFNDNYIWLIQSDKGNVVIDPGDAEPVIKFCEKENIIVDHIIITHHHYDHTGGVLGLKKNIRGQVIGPKNRNIAGIDKFVGDGDKFTIIGLSFDVLEVPGHTLDHLAFFASSNERNILFCGDTIFSGGCGRVFEGTFSQMYDSICKLMNLPKNTEIYCAHEYTYSNLKFALEVEPNNENIKNHINDVEINNKQNIPTIPTTLEFELKINPFLRFNKIELRESIQDKYPNISDASSEKVFEILRQWKDSL